MSGLSHFLHFCDFHIGGAAGPQAVFLDTLIGKVRTVCVEQGKPISAVFLTGDIAYSGLAREYETFATHFLEPLMNIPEVRNAKVFAVPGNHDVMCDNGSPVSWDTLPKRSQPIYFCEDQDGLGVRRWRVESFADYIDFVSKHSIISPNPRAEVSKLYSFEDNSFDVLLTNTSFFSDKEEDSSKPITPSPLTSLLHHVKSGPRSKPLLVVGHHSINTFRPPGNTQFEAFLWEKKAVYFHGHEHQPKPTVHPNGTLQALGFGASYVVNMQNVGTHDYVNSFVYGQFGEDLKLSCYTWQGPQGIWADTTAIHFHNCVTKHAGRDFATLRLPTFDTSKAADKTPLSQAPRSTAKPLSILPLGNAETKVWIRLFTTSANLQSILNRSPHAKVTALPEVDGKHFLQIEDQLGRHLVMIERGVNHVLSLKEVESLNTRLDTEDYQSVTVLSFGKISEDARLMYVRLRTKKKIEILTNTDFTEVADTILSAEQSRLMLTLDSSTNSVHILNGEEDVYLIVLVDDMSSKSFYLVGSSGATLLASDAVVAGLRAANPDFERMNYKGLARSPIDAKPAFNEEAYRNQSHKDCNVIRYAALASVGFQLSDHTLEELYVSGTASEIEGDKRGRLGEIVEDHLAPYEMSSELKEHIQKQLLSSFSENDRSKASYAREFCQKYPAVLLTGDPGSGKTCFVKNEILAYCRPRPAESATSAVPDWHAAHIPVLIQLSELAAEKELKSEKIYELTSSLLSRRGLDFPAQDIVAFEKQGRIAWFFDGLDEVVSVEKRALVVQIINSLVESAVQSGNRVVVTSRPAAVHVVNLLPSLKKLELQGLTEDEIATLAGRVLRVKLTTQENQLILAESADAKAAQLIRKLLTDCQQKPGVARLAQNPLLLTLLIMIYANAGAPSAKRHIIYERAVETLAAVRGREAGHTLISTQDLRERLGAVALSVYRKESGILPTRKEVCEVLRTAMTRQRGTEASSLDALKFLRKVAESTGLIIVQTRAKDDEDNAVVTFMHHSFLEYFAAVGLEREIDSIRIADLVTLPRWHEILTLLAGIIGERGDIAPILNRILTSHRDSSSVDAKLLLFAMDCALECDVPSEAAQRIISEQIRNCIATGPARIDPWIRSEIGVRAAQLFAACGGVEFDQMLADLMDKGDEDACAAAIGVLSYCFASGYSSDELLEAFNRSCGRNEDLVECAVCNAASKTAAFRTEVALQVVGRSLSKSSRRRQAAFEALSNIPSLASQHWGELINGMDDVNKRTSRLASVAAIQGGLNADYLTLSGSRKDVLVRALHVFDESAATDVQVIKVRRETVDQMLASAHRIDRLIGIQILPLSDADGQYVYEKLFEVIRGSRDNQEIGAALHGLRLNSDAAVIMKIGDCRYVATLARESVANIRQAAVRLLSCFGGSVEAVEALLDVDFEQVHSEEYTSRMNSLSVAKVLTGKVNDLLYSELDRLSGPHVKKNDENQQRLRSVLLALKRRKATAPAGLAIRLRNLADDPKFEEETNKAALLCYPAVAIPSQGVVTQLRQWIKNMQHGRDFELAQVPSIFASKCKESVDYVSAAIGGLVEFRTELIDLHTRISKRRQNEQTEYLATELRKGIGEISEIVVTFQDLLEDPTSLSKRPIVAGSS